MARQKTLKKLQKILKKTKWQENYGTLVLGAIIVVIAGLLIANFISQKKNGSIDTGIKTTDYEGTLDNQNPFVSQAGEYKVAEGDTLSKIAKNQYGSENFWPVLARANAILDPNVIYKDSALKIPSKAEAEEIQGNMTATTYKVESGDTLFKISEKVYGDGSAWQVLAKANNLGTLPNGNPLVFAGSTIVIPR